jgi:hypothetical protein
MKKFPCPCCGYLVFDEGPGSYDICPICFWEDDAVQLEFATNGGGANKVSLVDGQRNFTSIGACEESATAHVRGPSAADSRDTTWRPIDLNRDLFEDWTSPSARAPRHDEELYYWRTTFWRTSTRYWRPARRASPTTG